MRRKATAEEQAEWIALFHQKKCDNLCVLDDAISLGAIPVITLRDFCIIKDMETIMYNEGGDKVQMVDAAEILHRKGTYQIQGVAIAASTMTGIYGKRGKINKILQACTATTSA